VTDHPFDFHDFVSFLLPRVPPGVAEEVEVLTKLVGETVYASRSMISLDVQMWSESGLKITITAAEIRNARDPAGVVRLAKDKFVGAAINEANEGIKVPKMETF